MKKAKALKYQLLKEGIKNWYIYQGETIKIDNLVGISFKSSQTALNYVKNDSKANSLYFNKKVVTSAWCTQLDKLSFQDEMKLVFEDVKTIKVKDNITTVTLQDGRVGKTSLHDPDIYCQHTGFLYAYFHARKKAIVEETMTINGEAIIIKDFVELCEQTIND